MNILYKSKMTKVISSTMGGDEVGQARGRMGSRGGWSALNCVGSKVPLVRTLPIATWRRYQLQHVGCMDIPCLLATCLSPGWPYVLPGFCFSQGTNFSPL
jgi:hypothetical protein